MKPKELCLPKMPFFATLALFLALTFGLVCDSFARLIDESFEGTDYEEVWYPTERGDGCTLDPNYLHADIPGAPAPPPGGGSECLKSVSAASGYASYAERNLGSVFGTTFTRLYVYVGAEGLNDWQQKYIFAARDHMGNWVVFLLLKKFVGSDSLCFKFSKYKSTGWRDYYSEPISTDRWYRIEIKYDIHTGFSGGWEWRIDGVTQDAGDLEVGRRNGIQVWRVGLDSSAIPVTVYYDLVAVDAFDWVGSEGPDPEDPVFENFENAGGYDQEGWQTGGSRSPGGDVEPSAPAPGTAPGGVLSQSFKATVSASTADAYAYQEKTAKPVSYVRGYLYVDEEGLVNNDEGFTTLALYDQSGYRAAGIQIAQKDGVLKLAFVYYSNGQEQSPGWVAISEKTWILVDYKYDVQNSQCAASIDGGETAYAERDLSGAVREPAEMRIGICDHTGTGGNTVLYTDYVAWNSKQITYYVSGSGSNSPPYARWSTAASRIDFAIDQCKTASDTGTVIVRKKGTAYSGMPTNMKSGVDLVAEDPDDPPTINVFHTVHFQGPLTNCVLDGFRLTGGGIGGGGQIWMDGGYPTSPLPVTNVTIQNCLLDTSGGPGMRLNGPIAFTLKDTEIKSPMASGITTSESEELLFTGEWITIQGCKLYDAGGSLGGSGIALWGGSTFSAIYLRIGGDGDLSNHIYDNDRAGIRLEAFGRGSNVIIDNNTIEGNGTTPVSGKLAAGIFINNVASATITRNTIKDTVHAAGIAINGNTMSQNITIGGSLASRNNIYNNGRAGVVFGVGTQIAGTFLVQGNYIYSNDRGGIHIGKALLGENSLITISQNDIEANNRGGIGINNDCKLEITKNNIRNHVRGGIHTGLHNSFAGTGGDATNLTITKNKIHENGGATFHGGGGIDVRHASGTIENNLVYRNYRAGIRCGDHSDKIRNNTVVYNGIDYGTAEASDDRGGGIIYDDFEGAINDPPGGAPSDPFPIKNNICAYNVRAGIRACFYETEDTWGDKYRDHNLLYSNNQAFLLDWCGTFCASPDCSTGDSRDKRKCRGAQLGAGCDGETTFCCSAIGATGPVPGEMLIFANPEFQEVDGNPYHLSIDSPAIIDGYGEIGAYGGPDPLVDAEIPEFQLPLP